MRPELICLGEPLFELSQVPGEDSYRSGFGGDTSNAAVAAARQGARVGYVTALGEDAFGDAFLDLWRGEGIDTSQVRRDAGAPTGLYFVSHGPTGHRFSYYRAGSAASRTTPEALPLDYIRSAKALHLSGISHAIGLSACDAAFAAMEAAREAGVTVSYDTNLRLALWPLPRARAVIEAACALADIVRPGLDDARALTGLRDPRAIVDHYLAKGAKVVALTLGKEGVMVATPTECRRVGGPEVEAVDATGAGDVFDGAFLARLLAGDDCFQAAAYANAAAALSTTGYGAVAPIPRRAAVEAFMAERGIAAHT